MRIDAENKACTVIVCVDGAPEAINIAAQHASKGLREFDGFDGFIGGATHLSADGRRLVQYLQWRDEASHLACMNSPRWERSDSSRKFMQLVNDGRLTLNVGVYRVLKTISSGTHQD